ncbi:MAG: iron-containing alcohol dehydrogenase family protein [Lachnospiraceae bacterium]|nr:iron-containing alcohol dehydrogenase family protein [Lachnospiraceae bacterium]
MHQFRLPDHLRVEEGCFAYIPEMMEDVVPDLENKKTIIVTEKALKELFEDTLATIASSFGTSEFYLIEAATYDEAVDLAKYITMNEFGLVIGFGGGTVLDLAKFAAFVSKAGYICLPTTLSNDSLASPVAVLGTEGRARKTFKCTIPDAIFVDVSIIMSAPERQLLSGIGDTISKYTALNDWRIAAEEGRENVHDFAYMISKMAFNSICYNDMKELKSKDFIKRLTQALVMGGLAMEIAGSSRPSSGSEHLFCHALEENFADDVKVPHGIAVAMGSYAACKFQGRNIKKITRLLKEYNIPVHPSEWKITEDIFVGAWQSASATRPERYTILNEADLSKEHLAAIYKELEEL